MISEDLILLQLIVTFKNANTSTETVVRSSSGAVLAYEEKTWYGDITNDEILRQPCAKTKVGIV